ncbi:IclR family transcriptional regulator [Nocardiopsis sp. Huas11]|uniref:IclR family transcriptional regulator n=1 Tax=Nocardiopsis sp. Huas11 TaxID=2183912 RepID=UPI0018F61214|nr:helix-turn-helix domain-containing protein [Nocardiopsis sp. Huas11]
MLRTLDRGLEAINVISRSSQGVTVQDLATALDIHRAAAYRILDTLESRQFAHKGSDGTYRLGSGVLAVSHRFMAQFRVVAQPVIQDLANEVGMTAFLAVEDAGQALALAVAEPVAVESLGIRFQVGFRHPLAQGADGIAILAQRPERPGEPAAVTTARQCGYSVTSGENQPGAAGMAVGLGDVEALQVEASVGVIRLGGPQDLRVEDVLPHLEGVRRSLRSLLTKP